MAVCEPKVLTEALAPRNDFQGGAPLGMSDDKRAGHKASDSFLLFSSTSRNKCQASDDTSLFPIDLRVTL